MSQIWTPRERERLEAEAIDGQIGPSGHSPGEVV